MRRLIGTYRSFADSTRGVAAIEFAAILPVMVVIFLASYDAARAIGGYMKVRAATYALASITNQYAVISATDMTAILGATSVVMSPYGAPAPTVTVSQITINNAGVATIEWSASQNGTARAVGSAISPPAAMIVNGSYLILAEVTFTYIPLFGFFGPSAGMTFADNLYVTPRSVSCVVYTVQSNAC